MSLRLKQIVDALGGELLGASPDLEIGRIAPLESADADSISFLSNPKYLHQLAASQAACVVVAPAQQTAALQRGACIVAENPYLYFARWVRCAWWSAARSSEPIPCSSRA